MSNQNVQQVSKQVVIAGGGLAGLITAIQLSRAGIDCTVVEKKSYPFHRVCGEYISNETVPFLKKLQLYPEQFRPAEIHELMLSSVSGKHAAIHLPMGGFGISRYTFDQFLYDEARAAGVQFMLNTTVDDISFSDSMFTIRTPVKDLQADVVVGAFGKRSRVDVQMDRSFIRQRSPYVGVKYHIRTDHPAHRIVLHNFRGGYCGMSQVDQGVTNLCYLTHRDQLKQCGSIAALEEKILHENPFLRYIFNNSEFIFHKPETINEVSFAPKSPVEQHVLMGGDAAGMIAPLCGNGMAMAIHSAKLLADHIIPFCAGKTSRDQLEAGYRRDWYRTFSNRLRMGRWMQDYLFGNPFTSNLAVLLAISLPPVARAMVRRTHGDTF